MPGYYSGNPANVTVGDGTIATVVDATNTIPIVCETSTPHLYNTGDVVSVLAVGGNTAANSNPNNPWVIDVVDATHFSLRGSQGNGAFTTSGLAFNWSPNPPLTLQSPGDPDTMALRALPSIANADRTSYLALSTPARRIINAYDAATSDDTWSTWANDTPTGWTVLKNGGSPVGDLYAFSAPVPTVADGDVLDVSWELGDVTTATTSCWFDVALAVSSVSANAFARGAGGAKLVLAGVHVPITGHTSFSIVANGGAATITAFAANKVTLGGLSGMSSASVGDWIAISGANSSGNNGTFPITDYVSATSVKVYNPDGVNPDANSGSIVWHMRAMSFQLELMANGAGASAYTIKGHRSMRTRHYRPPFGHYLSLGGP